MKFLFACLFIVFGLGTGLAWGQETTADLAKFDGWVNYASPEGDFNIQFPGKPTTRQEPYNQNFSYLVKNFVTFESTPERRLELSYVDFKGQLHMLEEFQDRGLMTVANTLIERGATLVSKGDLTAGTCTGKEAVLRAVNPITKVPSLVKLRTFSSGTVVYFLFYGGGSDTQQELAVADHFLNSFSVFGGCKRPVASSGPVGDLQTITGTADAAGGQRIDSPYGVSFLFPGSAEFKQEQPSPNLPVKFYLYAYPGRNHYFEVQIYDGFLPQMRSNQSQLSAALERLVAGTKIDLEAARFVFGDCRPVQQGTLAGRECDLTLTGSELNGRVQFFVTPIRSIVLMGNRGSASAELEPVNRFFSTVRISPN